MISHLRGKLRKKNEDESSVEVDVGGVCYEVFLPMFVWRAFEDAETGDEVELETFYYASERQPIPKLVGFKRPVEREFFKKFIAVHELGVPTALKALIFSVSTIARWIEDGDTASLRRLPGIGARTADTIVAQLRGKVVQFALLRDEGFEEMPAAEPTATLDEVKQDAVAGLVGLGFQHREAARLVDEIVKGRALESVEEVIRAVFERMQQR